MAIIIGLTGGIATGKSTISGMFIKQGIPVIDSDLIAKQVVEVNEPAYKKIVESFGEDILLCTGHLNRKKIATVVFNDDKKRKKINSIIHPEVKKVILSEMKKYDALGNPFIVLDVPLLFESGFDDLCDFTVVVFTDKKTQYSRLMMRDNLTEEEAGKRIDAQWDIKEKLRLADFKIDNSLSILETRKQFDMLMKKLMKKENRIK
ncbi:dephospho-CoA kinase [Mycoplasmatota bacterium]|nr:dephospho-CoA kinase [Mycoplasmatota bacterium]